MYNQSAFGGMLQDLVELTSIVLRPELLDTEIKRRCKQAWEDAPCPECGDTAVQSGDDSPRVWCRSCRYTFTYTRNTPFQGRTLTPGEIVIAFVLYADTLLSIHQITQLFDAVYDTVHTTIREVEAALKGGFYLVWERIQHSIDGPTQIDETGRQCSGFKGQTPPRDGLSRGGSGDRGRSRWEGAPGDTMTISGACRDTLRVIRAERVLNRKNSNPHSTRLRASRRNSTKSGTTDGAGTCHSSTRPNKPWFTPKNLSRMTAFTSTKSNASGHC